MSLVRWYLAVQLVGWTAFVLIAPSAQSLRDAGLTVSKIAGVFLCGTVLWLGTAFGALRNDTTGAVVVALALVGGALLVLRSYARADRWRVLPPIWIIVCSELLFLTVFLGWAAIRSMDAATNHTEQPMDLMLLTAIATNPAFPPEDSWLAGYPVAYYYLGYWLMSTMSLLSAVEPAVAYNIGQACWLAMLVVACFGIGLNLVADSASRAVPIGAGLLTAVAVAWTSNARFVFDVIRDGRTALAGLQTGAWWWWPSSRVVHDVSADGAPIELITEFPFFSYLLGDNHPHMLAMPLVVLSALLAFNILQRGSARLSGAGADLLAFAVCAALIAVNTWDFPAVALLLIVCCAAAGYSLVWSLGLLAIAALVVAVPYLLTAQSQVKGVLLNTSHPTALAQAFVMFAPLAPGVLLLCAAAWRGSKPGKQWLCALAIAVPSWLVGWRLAALLVLWIASVLALLVGRVASGRHRDSTWFALLLALIGLCLVLAPEFAYVHDDFQNRMNTVFKTYYQAWLFLAVSGSVGIVLAWQTGGVFRMVAVAAFVALGVGFIYAPVAIWDRSLGFRASVRTLDGLQYVRRAHPDEFAAMDWVVHNTPRSAVIAQAVGRSYHPDRSRISTATGRPTLLGWDGHERQWRGSAFQQMAAGRADALRAIYSPSSDAELQQTLQVWGVSLVYVGPIERAEYAVTADHEARYNRVMELAFERGAVRIYRRR